MAERRTLTGITWNHTRGYLPLVAAAQRFIDADPTWISSGNGVPCRNSPIFPSSGLPSAST